MSDDQVIKWYERHIHFNRSSCYVERIKRRGLFGKLFEKKPIDPVDLRDNQGRYIADKIRKVYNLN